MTKHRSKCKTYKAGDIKSYLTSFLVVKHDDAEINLLEFYPCTSKEEQKEREVYWTKQFENRCNKRDECRSKKQWAIDNREHLREYRLEYNIQNKELIAERNKQYRLNNKEDLIEKDRLKYLRNKEKIISSSKARYEANKEEISIKRKERYSQIKDKISKKNKERIQCDCGSEVSRSGLNQHKKSMKHKNIITLIPSESS